jgi:hypothetical protein
MPSGSKAKDLNSYWHARLRPFKAGENVEYSLKRKSADGQALNATFSMHIGTRSKGFTQLREATGSGGMATTRRVIPNPF